MTNTQEALKDNQVKRKHFQRMHDNPHNELERAFKKQVLDAGSEPCEWSDEIVNSVHYMYLIYEMGWNALSECQQVEPVAYACFAENGNVRIWFGDKESALKWANDNQIDSPLSPLYTSPAQAPVEQTITDEEILSLADAHLMKSDGKDHYDYSGQVHWWGTADGLLEFARALLAKGKK